jgi:predicted naringenin-chalcone synthase
LTLIDTAPGHATNASRPVARQPLGTGREPRISALAVADSGTSLDQAQVLARLGLAGDEFAEGIFARCGVRRRHLSLDEDLLNSTLEGRTRRVEGELFAGATRAIDALAIDAQRIGTVVSSSLYSLGCPTLAHRLVDHYRMDPATDKYHVVGVGCASAVPLLRLASQSLAQHPHKPALVVAAESMSAILRRARGGDPRAKTVGSAIFGDGCAAALLSGEDAARGPRLLACEVRHLAGTLDAVSLFADGEDSYLHLARELPDLASRGLGELVDAFLDGAGAGREAIDHWVVHPGGRRIIEQVQAALGLSHGDVAVSRDVLADHGNVGTPSIFYVLDATTRRRLPRVGDVGAVVTIGPGVTVGLMLLQW